MNNIPKNCKLSTLKRKKTTGKKYRERSIKIVEVECLLNGFSLNNDRIFENELNGKISQHF